MPYDVKFYLPKHPVATPDELTPDNLEDMGSGDALKVQLAPVIPEFIWWPICPLGSHMCHRAIFWHQGHQFFLSFWAEPANSFVALQVRERESPGRAELVQRISDDCGWVALVDCWEPPHPRSRSLVLPRHSSGSSGHRR